jgi:mRNA interferase MazF
LLLADEGRGDWIACQITSNPYADPLAVELRVSDCIAGGLQRVSFARPGKLFTANERLFSATVATVRVGKLSQVRDAVVTLIQQGS